MIKILFFNIFFATFVFFSVVNNNNDDSSVRDSKESIEWYEVKDFDKKHLQGFEYYHENLIALSSNILRDLALGKTDLLMHFFYCPFVKYVKFYPKKLSREPTHHCVIRAVDVVLYLIFLGKDMTVRQTLGHS